MRNALALFLASMLMIAMPGIAQAPPAAPVPPVERQIFLLEMLILDGTTNPEHLNALKDDHSLDAVKARLEIFDVEYLIATAKLDTADLTPDIARRILNLPPGEPFMFPSGDKVLICVIVGSEQAPAPAI